MNPVLARAYYIAICWVCPFVRLSDRLCVCQLQWWSVSKRGLPDLWAVVLSIEYCRLPSSRHHRSNGDCVEGNREIYQVCSVQCCVQQLCTVQWTHIWTDPPVLWIEFCLTGPVSLCLDSFVYCVSLYIVCMRSFVTWWGGPGGIEAYP